ncbi:hypothetical protein CC86DRAFT_452521 [Ophiobolus disseminans]|uniref:Uncharacterized protein n=1 Tax=Ophiobolus disseminans TaxID=1469910 RepID=A0A6A7AFH7_9PLEO|nr:hypothetical protein CC86DRAFT_452521 [Ophiobolus disseminans]
MSSQDDISYSAIPKSMVSKSTESIQSSPDATERTVEWHISLRAPLSMLALFLSGVLVSVGHHIFYLRLNGSAVRDPNEGSQYLSQIWIIRYGTAFAFLAKALLASAVVVAYKQHMWINLRMEANTISTIDAMFAATYDILAFLSPNLLLRAKILALMALITWFLPLAALVTPSTLTVIPAMRENITMIHVPTLNFKNASLYNFDGLGDGTSPLLTRLTSAMASNMQILPMPAIAPNTTYNHTFQGPSLKCVPATGPRLDNMTAIWNATETRLNGTLGGQLMYLAYTLTESQSFINVSSFVSDCIIADAYTSCPMSGSVISARIGNESLECSVKSTNFDVEFHAIGNTQTITKIRYPRSGEFKGESSGAMSQALATILTGAIGVQMKSKSTDESGFASLVTWRTRVMSTALIGLVSTAFSERRGRLVGKIKDIPDADRQLAGNRTLAKMIEELSRNQTLSLFSDRRMWLPQNATNKTSVTQSTSYTIYEYRPRNLIMTYSIAIAFSAFGVLLGLRAVWLNGICHETSFSSIMSTTRNQVLDDLTLGYSLGSAPTPHAVTTIKLRFGVLRDGEQERSRAAFGLEEETVPLRKGQVVY